VLDEWLTSWGVELPQVETGLPIWPVIAVVVLMLMINVAANKAIQSYYLFWTLGGSVVVLALGLLDGCTWGDLGLAPSTWISGAIWGAGLMAIVFAVYAIGSTWRRTREAFRDNNIAGLSLPRLFWQALVELPFGTVLFEEIAFRAVLWAMLARRYGVGWATVLSALLFGLWHILPSLDLHLRNQRIGEVGGNRARIIAIVGSVITTAIGGFVFSLLRIGTGSLLPPMGLHWSTNGWGYLFARRVSGREPRS